MTYLGTRPPTVDEWDKYELHHRARLATKPGLTGMWQVSGRSNITDLKMANWTIECADRYLAVFYDYLHKYIYKSPVIHADETPVLVRKDGRMIYIEFLKTS